MVTSADAMIADRVLVSSELVLVPICSRLEDWFTLEVCELACPVSSQNSWQGAML